MDLFIGWELLFGMIQEFDELKTRQSWLRRPVISATEQAPSRNALRE
jgi:hypothetical protein